MALVCLLTYILNPLLLPNCLIYFTFSLNQKQIELLKKSKDEAYIMADAFRIAFEQQLMQRKDQAQRLAEVIKIKKGTKFINWKRLKEDGNWACYVSAIVK